MLPLNEFRKVIIVISDEDLENLDRSIRQLRNELEDLDIGQVEFDSQGKIPIGSKSIDPATLNALILGITPLAVTKLLEFLYSWMMRKEGRTIKIKMQKDDGRSIEIEVPVSTSQQELKGWIKTVESSISADRGKRK